MIFEAFRLMAAIGLLVFAGYFGSMPTTALENPLQAPLAAVAVECTTGEAIVFYACSLSGLCDGSLAGGS